MIQFSQICLVISLVVFCIIFSCLILHHVWYQSLGYPHKRKASSQRTSLNPNKKSKTNLFIRIDKMSVSMTLEEKFVALMKNYEYLEKRNVYHKKELGEFLKNTRRALYSKSAGSLISLIRRMIAKATFLALPIRKTQDQGREEIRGPIKSSLALTSRLIFQNLKEGLIQMSF